LPINSSTARQRHLPWLRLTDAREIHLSDEPKTYTCRIAIRTEGEFVNAYWAKVDTLADAVLICSVKRAPMANPALFEQFKRLAEAIITQTYGAAFGSLVGPTFVERPAPDTERSGNA
jgi:cellulase/cellobiase CelA1